MAHPKSSSRGHKMLITVKVVGSPGPIRLLVDSDDSIAAVICRVLKEYSRQRRLPVLGNDAGDFDLCCSCVGGALSSSVAIGSTGFRNFSMIKRLDFDGALNSCEVLGSRMKKIHVNGSFWDSKLSIFKKMKKPRTRLRSLLSNLITISSHGC